MLKLKIFLLAILFAFTSYSVTYASVLSDAQLSDEEQTYLQSLSNEVDIILAEREESNVPVQEVLDKELDYPYGINHQWNQTPKSKSYTVTEGDNLYRIALNHNISLDSLTSLNDLTGDLIHPGDVLIDQWKCRRLSRNC